MGQPTTLTSQEDEKEEGACDGKGQIQTWHSYPYLEGFIVFDVDICIRFLRSWRNPTWGLVMQTEALASPIYGASVAGDPGSSLSPLITP